MRATKIKSTSVNFSSSSHWRIYAPQMREKIKKEENRRLSEQERNKCRPYQKDYNRKS